MINEENNDKLWEDEDFVAQFPPNKSYEYALNEGYDKAEDLKNAILNLSEALSKFN